MTKITLTPGAGDWWHCYEATRHVEAAARLVGARAEREDTEPTSAEVTLDFYTSVEDQLAETNAIVAAAQSEYAGAHLVNYAVESL